MPLYSEPYNNLERGYNDDNGNPSDQYSLQWGAKRLKPAFQYPEVTRAAQAAQAQQSGNSPEVERALAMARHQVQLEKERQAQVQAEEIQKRIQAGILRERAERAKARQAQAAKKKQQQRTQQPQTQAQQPQAQTQQPQTQAQQPQTQPQPQAQTQQPQTQAPTNQPTQQPQAPDSDYSQMAPDRGNWNPYAQWLETQRGTTPSSGTPQTPAESEGDRRLRELQERDRRMLRLGPQGRDIILPPPPANQQSQAQTQQPQAQTQPSDSGYSQMAPDRGNWNPYAQWLETQRGAPSSSGTPQAPTESEGDRRLRELQERDQRMLALGPQGGDTSLPPPSTSQQPQGDELPFFGNPEERPALTNQQPQAQQPQTQTQQPQSQVPAESEGDRRLRDLQERDQRMLRLEPQGGDSGLLGWLWNKITGPSPMNGGPGVDPNAPYGPLPEGTSPPAATPEQRDLFGPVGTSPMNGGPGVDPNAPYGPLPGDTNVPDVEADPNMPVVVDTGPNMDPGIMAPGSEPSNPTPGIQTLPNMIPETPAVADPRADLFGPVGTSPMNGGPGVDPNAPYGSLPAATPEQRDFFGPVGTSSMNGYQPNFDDAAIRAYLKAVNGLDNFYNWGVQEVRPRFEQWRKETLEPALERGKKFFDEAPEGLRRSREKQAAEQAEQARRIQEDGYLIEFLRQFGEGLGLR